MVPLISSRLSLRFSMADFDISREILRSTENTTPPIIQNTSRIIAINTALLFLFFFNFSFTIYPIPF